MSETQLRYKKDDEVSVKATFDTLMTRYMGDKVAVLAVMKNNPIAVANADDWEAELYQTIEIAKPWVVGEALLIGWLRMYNGQTYLCVQAHTTQADWTPDVVPALFTLKPKPQVGQQYPDWVQPLGAQDAYNIGDRVHFEGSNYESVINANVWSPTAYPAGWVEI
jgi:hypothetical protein